MLEIFEELNNNLKNNIKSYKAMAIADIQSGDVLFSDTIDATFDIDLAAECNLEVIKAKLKAIDTLGIDDALDKIVVHLEDNIHIMDLTKSKHYFIYLALEAKNTNIGLINILLNRYKVKLNDVI